MTVAELMERLKGFDPELPVVVAGYEGGGQRSLLCGSGANDPGGQPRVVFRRT